MNQDLLSVSEFADLCNVTAETLRYYDKEELLKPIYINPHNKYRYYSVEQYRCAKVICELREQNFSISQIKDIFEDDTKKFAEEILTNNLNDVNSQISQLKKVKENIETKLNYLQDERLSIDLNVIKEKNLSGQYVLINDECNSIINYKDLYYTISFYEKNVRPIVYPRMLSFSDDLYINIVHSDNEKYQKDSTQFSMGIMVDSKTTKLPPKTHIKEIKNNKFITFVYKGRFLDFYRYIDKILDYINEHNYSICGDVLVITKAGHILISPCLNMHYEIRIPVTYL